MKESMSEHNESRDPLGLSELPLLNPPEDGWKRLEAALLDSAVAGNARRWRIAVLATAACAVLATFVIMRGPAPVPMEPTQAVATAGSTDASMEQEQALSELISMSQTLEQQLRGMRKGTGPIPATSAVYVAELEDLVAQVDNQLSVSPDSINLWGQRVNLLLDLAQIYQHQWEREYGRMASL